MKLKLITLFAIAFMTACSPEGSTNDERPEKSYEIKEIDGCEYIYVSRKPWSGEFSLTHKGNCKNPIHDCKLSGLH